MAAKQISFYEKYKYIKGWLLILIALVIGVVVNIISSSITIKPKLTPISTITEANQYFQNRVLSLMEKNHIPGCEIAIVRNGEIVMNAAYGYADINKAIPLTTDTPMRVQSISKSVTSWAVMKIYQAGLIDVDAPIVNYLKTWEFPESRFLTEKITIRHLLTHTAGLQLGDVFTIYSPDDEVPTLRENLSKEAILVQNPNEGFIYSNVGFNLLELLIEEVTGIAFSEYMETEILKPLGMDTSTFIWESLTKLPPKGYDLQGDEVIAYVYPEKGSGGLFSTASDLARFAIAGMEDNPVLSQAKINEIYTIQSDNVGVYNLVFDGYGYGHYIERLDNGLLSISHGGQGTGIMTHFQAVPETKDAIIILTNSQRSWPMIASILRDWADWCQLGTMGMEVILFGEIVIGFLIGIILAIALFVLIKIGQLIFVIKPINSSNYYKKYLFILLAIVLNGILAWCMMQKYLLITSIFPNMSIVLGKAIFVLSIMVFIYNVSTIPIVNFNKEKIWKKVKY